MLNAPPPSPPEPRETIDVVATVNAFAAGAAVAAGAFGSMAEASSRLETYGLRTLCMASAAVITATFPVTMRLFFMKRSDRVTRKVWFSLAAALVSVAYVTWWLRVGLDR